MGVAVLDAKGQEHEVEQGAWWWADRGDGPEVVQVDPRGTDHGVWLTGWECAIDLKEVTLLSPVVPYVPPGSADRSPRFDPQAGDTKTHPSGTPIVRVIARRGDQVLVTDGLSAAAPWTLDEWSALCANPSGGDEMWATDS